MKLLKKIDVNKMFCNKLCIGYETIKYAENVRLVCHENVPRLLKILYCMKLNDLNKTISSPIASAENCKSNEEFSLSCCASSYHAFPIYLYPI